MKYLLALGLLGTAIASPHAIPAPQSQQEIDPNPSLTYSLRDPEVTEFQTQNGTDASSTTSGASATESPTLTEIAAFTVPNGGIYTATAIGGTAQIAGHVLTLGGPDALVGGVRVSVASDGFKFGDRTAAYATVTGSSTVEVVSTVTDAQGSSTGVVNSSATVVVAESSATESASATESSGEDASSTSESSSAAESSSATGGAAAGATARSKAAFTALGGLAVLLCVFA